MKILLVTANFATAGTNPWLLDDLVEQLSSDGHRVDVLVHSPTAPRERGPQPSTAPSVSIYSVGAARAPRGPIAKLASYVATGIRLHTRGWRWARGGDYDLCIYPSIAVFSYGFPSRLRRAAIARRLVFILWDFFPVHQMDIGRIRPRGLAPLLKRLERRAIKDADAIAVMSPANASFLARYQPGLAAEVVIVPPWAAEADPGREPARKRERFTVIFGGQLVRGRGVETLLDAAHLLNTSSPDVDILIAGSGVEAPRLRQRAVDLGLDNVTFTGNLERGAYRQLLRECHVGIAITVEGVSPPSFPSKIVEYCANAIPVIVAVEESSDAGSIVESHGAGFAVAAGDPPALADAIARAALEHGSGALAARSARARDLFDSELSVISAAKRLTGSGGTP